MLGRWSSKLFAIALLASGQSSTITGTYAGQYVMQVLSFLIYLVSTFRSFFSFLFAIIVVFSPRIGSVVIPSSSQIVLKISDSFFPLRLSWNVLETLLCKIMCSSVIKAIH